MNPYTPPMAPLGNGPVQPVSRERADQLAAELKSLNNKSLGIGVIGLILQFVGQTMGGFVGLGVVVAGTALFIFGLFFYAKLRGRHPVFCVLGLASCLGLLILYFLPKSCLNCGETHSFGKKTCERCGAPLGA